MSVLDAPRPDPPTLHSAGRSPGRDQRVRPDRNRQGEDFLDLFVPRFYFGCEADDPLVAWAFAEKVNPLGAPVPSHLRIGHLALGRTRYDRAGGRSLTNWLNAACIGTRGIPRADVSQPRTPSRRGQPPLLRRDGGGRRPRPRPSAGDAMMSKLDARPLRTVLFCAGDQPADIERGLDLGRRFDRHRSRRAPDPVSRSRAARAPARRCATLLDRAGDGRGAPHLRPGPAAGHRPDPEGSAGRHGRSVGGSACPQGRRSGRYPRHRRPARLHGGGSRICRPDRPMVYPILETAQALRLAYDIAVASPRVSYMGGAISRFGDIHQALGFRWTAEGTRDAVPAVEGPHRRPRRRHPLSHQRHVGWGSRRRVGSAGLVYGPARPRLLRDDDR